MRFIFLTLSFVFLSSNFCHSQQYMDAFLFDNYEWKLSNISKIDFQMDSEVTLRRRIFHEDSDCNGEAVKIDGKFYDEIIFELDDKGEVVEITNDGKLYISFDKKKKYYLSFQRNPADENIYTLLHDRWDNEGNKIVKYAGREYVMTGSARLTFDKIKKKYIPREKTAAYDVQTDQAKARDLVKKEELAIEVATEVVEEKEAIIESPRKELKKEAVLEKGNFTAPVTEMKPANKENVARTKDPLVQDQKQVVVRKEQARESAPVVRTEAQKDEIAMKAAVVATDKQQPTRKNDIERKLNGNGTGIILSQDGYIATNYHVIDGANYISIIFSNDNQMREYKASVIKTDKNNDLAIIKINDSSYDFLDTIKYSVKTELSDIAEEVFSLGYPAATSFLGVEVKFTDGKISSRTGAYNDVRVYQTTVPILQGSSGEPLFDYDGNLIGINSSKVVEDNYENISYAIKASYLKNLIDILPESIVLPSYVHTQSSLSEKVKVIDDYVVLIKVRRESLPLNN